MELPGLVLRLTEKSVLLLDIKKMDLTTGTLSDYGFTMQPLIHRLKDRDYLITGRYQMPVYKGSVPQELLNRALQVSGRQEALKPRNILKYMAQAGQVELLSTLQVVTDIADLLPPEDAVLPRPNPTPSMLHHLDKQLLSRYILTDTFFRTSDTAETA